MSMNIDIVRKAVMQYVDSYMEIKDLGGYHNKVYEVKHSDSESIILRFSKSSRRTSEELRGEIGFLNLLLHKGAPVIKPRKSLTGEYVSLLEQENSFYVTCFERAAGLDWFQLEKNTSRLMINVGKAAGQIHRAAKTKKEHFVRKSWSDNEYLHVGNSILDKVNPLLTDELRALMKQLQSLPTSSDNFGLIHGDYLFSNYLVDGENVTVIDFDESEYSWYLYDIAVNLYYYTLGGLPKVSEKNVKYAEAILYYFLLGYLKETALEDSFFESLPLFMRLREFKLLISVCRSCYPDRLNEWQQSFVEAATGRILEHRDIVSIDYSAILKKTRQDMNSRQIASNDDLDALRGLF